MNAPEAKSIAPDVKSKPEVFGSTSWDRQAYLSDPVVVAFMSWLENDLREPGSFRHDYRLVQAGENWSCEGLYKAYQSYWRPFHFACPIQERKVKGENFTDSYMHLNRLSEIIRDALRQSHFDLAIDGIRSALLWGKVIGPQQDGILDRIKKEPQTLAEWQTIRLDALSLDTLPDLPMSVSWSLVYALFIDDFVSYDGRVGAGLGLLARLFSQKQKLDQVPDPIRFSFASSRVAEGQKKVDRRNPGKRPYTLPRFSGRPRRHLADAIKASWLMKALVSRTDSRFALIPQVSILDERLYALQAALYMIGYDLRDF